MNGHDRVGRHPLRELVSPERAALLIVDVQNDYCHDQGAYGRMGVPLEAIRRAVENLLGVVRAAREVRLPVVFVKTHHDRWMDSPTWAGLEVPRCVTGTWGAELYRVQPVGDEPIVIKHRHSGFYETSLDVMLRALGRRSVLVTGVTANVCVESTVRDAVMRDYHVVLVEDCAGAASKEEHDATCWNVRRYFGHVLDSRRLLTLWGRGEG